nr:translocase of chloroplast 120, chloroplastic-like [Tanacetum cinerariifolium]
MTTTVDDEVAPRRNAGRTFKVADQNLITTRTMDDEDAPGLKANEQKVEQNEEVVPKCFKPSSGSTSAIHEPEVERGDDKVSESVADSSEIHEQKDEDMPLNKEPESRPVIGVSLSTKSVAPTPSQANGNVSPPQNQVIDEPANGEAEENDKTREKLQMIQVKFLRLARRLGKTPHNVVVEQVLHRLGLAEQLRGRNGGRVAAFSFERASAMAEQEKLFMKKQLKDENKQRKMMKKMAEAAKNFPTLLTDNNVEEDSNAAATVPVAVQDMTLPASFDADNPTNRYRALDYANQWLIKPVLDPHGGDHDELSPGKMANVVVTVAFDMQTVGKEMSYSLCSETRFISYRKNKSSAGLSATYFGDTLTGGVKFEDKLMINKRGELVVAGGAVIARGDVAYGGCLEATLRDKDFPLGRFLSTIGLAGSGQVSVRLNSSDQLQIALAALVPLVSKLIGIFKVPYTRLTLITFSKAFMYICKNSRLRKSGGEWGQVVKTVLDELVKLRGTAIKGRLSRVQIDMEPQPIILAYIDVNLQVDLDEVEKVAAEWSTFMFLMNGEVVDKVMGKKGDLHS